MFLLKNPNTNKISSGTNNNSGQYFFIFFFLFSKVNCYQPCFDNQILILIARKIHVEIKKDMTMETQDAESLGRGSRKSWLLKILRFVMKSDQSFDST
jgi:hypothetical protein